MEVGFNLDIPEFRGCSKPEEFLDLINVMNEATDKWLFTSKIIPDPIVDWSKSTIFNEELVEEIPRIEDDIKLLQQKNIPAVLALDTIMGQTCENCISYTANQIIIST